MYVAKALVANVTVAFPNYRVNKVSAGRFMHGATCMFLNPHVHTSMFADEGCDLSSGHL